MSWKTSARAMIAAGLAVLLGQSLSPTGAQSIEPGTVMVPAREAKARLLKPNLVALKANDLHIERDSRGRLLRFESGIGNAGRGPIEVRPNTDQSCPTGKHHATQVIYRDVDGSRFYRRSVDTRVARLSAGCMLFHPAH